MVQLIAIGVVILALAGSWFAHEASLREQGAAETKLEYERQAKNAAAENEKIALEGKAAVLRLLAEAEQKNRVQATKLAALQKQRKGADDAQAAKDPVFKAWLDEPVPAAVASRLRGATILIAANASGSSVPGGTGLQAGTNIPDSSGPVDESWIAKFRRKLSGSNQVGVGPGGDGGK